MDKTITHSTLVGPKRFSTNTIEKMQEANGFSLCMGQVEKIIPTKPFSGKVLSKKIAQGHIEPNFIAIMELERQGDRTFLNWFKLYEAKAIFGMLEKHHKTNKGFKHIVEKPGNYLSPMTTSKMKE